MKRLLFILIGLVLVTSVQAQNSKVQTAGLNMSSGDLEKAFQAIEMAVVHPKTKVSAKAWYYRGEIIRLIMNDETGKYDSLTDNKLQQAYESYLKAMEFDEKNKYSYNIATVHFIELHSGYYGEGRKAITDKDWETSYSLFSTALDIIKVYNEYSTAAATYDTFSVYLKAYSAEKLGNMEEANATYQELVDKSFKSLSLYERFSDMYKNEKNYEKALEILSKGQEVFPNEKSMIINELNIYIVMGKADEAVEKFKKALELDSENPTLWTALGVVYDQLFEKALDEDDQAKADEYHASLIEAYEKSVSIEPENYDAQYNLGVTYYNDAVRTAAAMEKVPLKDKAKYNELKMNRNKQFMDALPYLERAKEIDPDKIGPVKVLGTIYFNLGDMDKYSAMKDLQKEMEEAEK